MYVAIKLLHCRLLLLQVGSKTLSQSIVRAKKTKTKSDVHSGCCLAHVSTRVQVSSRTLQQCKDRLAKVQQFSICIIIASAVCFVADMPDEIRISRRAKASVMTRCSQRSHPSKMARTESLQTFWADSGIDPARCLQQQTYVQAVAHIQPEFEYDDLRFLSSSQQLQRDFCAKLSFGYSNVRFVLFQTSACASASASACRNHLHV